MELRHLGIALSMVAAFLTGTLVPSVQSQSETARYLRVGYMKVKPGNQQEYLRLEQDVWKPIHEHLVKNGKKKSWFLYGVRSPGGTNQEYNFVTLNVFDTWQDLETPGYPTAVREVHPDKKPEDIGDRTRAARDQVRTEIWALMERVE